MPKEAQNIGNNIRLLRRRSGLTIKSLAARIGIQPGPLGKLEAGKHRPSAGVLLRLAETFNTSIDALFLPTGASTHGLPRIHRLDDLVVPPDLIDRLQRVMDEVFRLEDRCGVPKHAHIPFNFHAEPRLDAMEDLANRVRRALGIGDSVLFDYVEMFEARGGFRVLSLDLPPPFVAIGVHDPVHANAFFFVNHGGRGGHVGDRPGDVWITPERKLFALAYEFGLLLLGQGLPSPQAVDPEHIRKLARHFAAIFLLPRGEVLRTLHQLNVRPGAWTLPLILRLKVRFGVSAEMFTIRLEELDQITTPEKDAFREQIRATYKDRREPGESHRFLSENARLGDLLLLADDSGDEDEAGDRESDVYFEVLPVLPGLGALQARTRLTAGGRE